MTQTQIPIGRDLSRGNSTAFPVNISYRIRSIGNIIKGQWLDLGCADGGYTEALQAAGASSVWGLDTDPERIVEANARHLPHSYFTAYDGHKIPYASATFEGAFMNETMEHVFSEQETLAELHRVLKPGGYLVVISPNRFFPFEGHTTTFLGKDYSPFPLVPWLPRRWWESHVDARNYWPWELRDLVNQNSFHVIRCGYIWPVFELMPWLPKRVIKWYQRHIDLFGHLPLVRRFGVSNLIIARRDSAR